MPDAPLSSHHVNPGTRILAWIIFLFVLSVIGWFAYEFYRSFQVIRADTMSYVPGGRPSSGVLSAEQMKQLVPSDAPFIGASAPTLTIVEFVDFDCPFCRSSVSPIRSVINRYQDRVRLVVRHFPIPMLHPRAPQASLAAQCAHEQNRFWAFHDRLYATQGSERTDEEFIGLAQELGLDKEAFNACYRSTVTEQRIQRDLTDGLQFGIQGTPTFFFNGVKIDGAVDEKQFERLVKEYLKITN